MSIFAFLWSIDFVTWWKASSILFTGFFGILGLLTEYKDKETHKITKWGWTSLAGILISTGLGVLAQLKESSQQQAQRDATAKQTLQMLTGVQRSLSVLDEPALYVSLAVPCEGIYLPFCADVEVWKKSGAKGPPPYTVLQKWPGTPPGHILVGLFIYQDESKANGDDKSKPDWFMNFQSPAFVWFDPLHNNQLAMSFSQPFNQPVRPFVNQNNGKFISFDDLIKATMVVAASAPMPPGSTPPQLRPLSIALVFRNGRTIGAEEKNFVPVGKIFKAKMTTKREYSNVEQAD